MSLLPHVNIVYQLCCYKSYPLQLCVKIVDSSFSGDSLVIPEDLVAAYYIPENLPQHLFTSTSRKDKLEVKILNNYHYYIDIDIMVIVMLSL